MRQNTSKKANAETDEMQVECHHLTGDFDLTSALDFWGARADMYVKCLLVLQFR
jgi:hypothetical protein